MLRFLPSSSLCPFVLLVSPRLYLFSPTDSQRQRQRQADNHAQTARREERRRGEKSECCCYMSQRSSIYLFPSFFHCPSLQHTALTPVLPSSASVAPLP
mmetsp:Transcript_13430/g.26577  ORF Transcript_13430/g.26577 Transcript_13430/m.26577 type:complete len:99 (-) Transcript_13430:1110-1406(-)